MDMSFFQYIKDTRSELRHVAWPTQTQTVVFTILVVAISIGISLYLGLFDFLFTTGLSRFLQVLPASTPATVNEQSSSATSTDMLPQFTTQLGTTSAQ